MSISMRTLAAMSLSVVFAAGCGSEDPESSVDSGRLAPPPEGKGIQLKMLSRIEAGTEVEHCQFIKGPPEPLYLNRDEVQFSEGSHHIGVYETFYKDIPVEKLNGTPVDTSGVFDCSDGPTNGWWVKRPLAGSQNRNGGSFISFPKDVAISLTPNTVFLVNIHYVNTSPTAIEPEIRINLHTIPEEDVKTEGDILGLYNSMIFVGANSSGSARMRCPVHRDITIQNLQSHMHARGVGFDAFIKGQEEPIYTTSKWADVPVKDFGAGLKVAAGSRLDYRCDYTNTETRDIFQGPRSSDEMCMLIGSYYPADQATANCWAYQDAPTGSPGAEWVGNGTASCAETLNCVNAALAINFNQQALMRCVVAADPAVTQEASTATKCAIWSFQQMYDPSVACQTEFAACNAK